MAAAVKTPKRVYRAILMKKREELLASCKAEPEVLSANIPTPDEGDFALKAADQAVAAATLDLISRMLKEIDAALIRVGKGTYGLCEKCGEEISTNRLKAIPWARHCLACEENRSNN